MLRAFWKVSFIKIDDEENKALKNIFLQNNEEFLSSNNETESFFTFNNTLHKAISNKLNTNDYSLNVKDMIQSSSNDTNLNHEMALECGTIYQIVNNINNTFNIFGKWDYISHQVIASPFKPIDYMDKMDIFGYKYIQNYPGTISKYFVIELKRDSAKIEDIEQLLKYVDWVNQEYSSGNYCRIKAFLVAKKIDSKIVQAKNDLAIRNFITGRRPVEFHTWNDITLVEYSFNTDTCEICYKVVS